MKNSDLMKEFGLETLERLSARASALADQFANGSDPTATFRGRDQTGSVELRLNSSGFVTDISMARHWRKAIAPHQLGAAVLEAIDAANQERFVAWGKGVAEAPAEPSTSVPVERRPSTPGDKSIVDEVLDLLDAIDFDVLQRDAVALAQLRASDQGPGRHVTVTLSGPTVTEVEFDRNWLARANNLEISTELCKAFRAAYERATEARANNELIALRSRLRAVTADPNRLFEAFLNG